MEDCFYDRCRCLVRDDTPFVVVTLVKREGSVPQDVGSKMIVTESGWDFGTVGGGRIEARSIEHALAMMAAGGTSELVKWNLNTDIGMTCGGRLELFFEPTIPDCWSIAIFGAGHVTQALTRLLETLPCRVTCIDSRAEWLAQLPDSTHQVQLPTPADYVDRLAPSTYVLSMTQGHSSDLPILKRLWQSRVRFPFVGVIGSRSKAGALRRELGEAGMPDGELQFHCPVGLPLGTNHPGEIAVSIASQLLQVRDQVRSRTSN